MAGFAMTACTEDEYVPGADVAPTCQQVYFSNENEAAVLLPASGASQQAMVLQVVREKTEGEITVPVKVISASEGLVIPESVTFASGERETELAVNLPENAQEGNTYSFQIELEGENTDPYSALPGSIRFFGSIKVADIIQATGYLGSGKGGTFTVTIERTGENAYRIDDFFGSGYALDFTVDPSTGNLTLDCGYGYLYDPYWYFYDYDAGVWLTFKQIVTYIQAIYNGSGYTYWDEAGQTACIYLYGVSYEDGGSADWDYFILEW